jgi:hypothetical protein
MLKAMKKTLHFIWNIQTAVTNPINYTWLYEHTAAANTCITHTGRGKWGSWERSAMQFIKSVGNKQLTGGQGGVRVRQPLNKWKSVTCDDQKGNQLDLRAMSRTRESLKLMLWLILTFLQTVVNSSAWTAPNVALNRRHSRVAFWRFRVWNSARKPVILTEELRGFTQFL